MRSNYLISRLLSGTDRLARIEKDALREAILDQVAPRRRRRRALMGGALALASAAALLVAVPLVMVGDGPAVSGPGEFTARGLGGPAAALALACPSSGEAHCEQGETVVFDVSGSAGYRYLAAFARRDDGAVIWYFPGPGEARGVSLATAGALDRGAVVGPDHPPGAYLIYGVFSDRPLSRDEIIARFDESGPSAGPGTAVVSRELVVQ